MVAGHDGRVGLGRVRRHDGIVLHRRRRPVDIVSRAPAVRLVVILLAHDNFLAPDHATSHE